MTEQQSAQDGQTAAPAPIVMMGVSGCGKSVVGEKVAEGLGFPFVEGDQLHPPENVALMESGRPLQDENRWGWLDAIGRCIAAHMQDGDGAVAACSALKRAYRDRLRGFQPDILFVHLAIDRETARQRVGGRKGHFMPPSLVESQFADLQPPETDENALNLDGTRTIDDLAAEIVDHVRRSKAVQGR